MTTSAALQAPFEQASSAVADGVQTEVLLAQSPTLRRIVSTARLMGYTLPGSPEDQHIIGVSGGADSAALCIILHVLFGTTHNLLPVFTDTMTEVDGTEDSIKALENVIGKTVTRVIAHDTGLYGLIESFTTNPEKGFFLPSGLVRYCTRILKTEAIEDFLEGLRGDSDDIYYNYAGLRADEPARDGFDSNMPWLHTHFPLRDLGLAREDVFALLSETVGVPRFYMNRSRSGCEACWGMRSSEFIATLEHSPASFDRAMKYETLTEEDAKRFAVTGEDWSYRAISLPIPAEVDARTASDFAGKPRRKRKLVKRKNQEVYDLFAADYVDLWVGMEYLVSEGLAGWAETLCGTPGVWHQSLVGWSTSGGGIARKLNSQYWTRMDTCEVFGLTQDQFKEEYKQAVFHLEIPADLIDLGDSSKGTFSWRKDEPLQKIRHIANIVKQCLYKISTEIQAKEYEPFKDTVSWEAEHYEAAMAVLESWDKASAEVLETYLHQPGERPAPKDASEMPCFVCSK